MKPALAKTKAISKLKESHAGKNEGFKHNLGFEFGIWTDDDDTVDGETEASAFTALTTSLTSTQLTVGAYLTIGSEDDGSAETDSQIITLFAGYAVYLLTIRCL